MCCADKVIGVAAVTDKDTISRIDDEICDFSTRGPRKDDGDDNLYDELQPTVAAYGAGVFSAKYNTEDEYWCSGDGTCPATAHIAGVVALMLEANPKLTPLQVRQILQETAEQRGMPEYPEYPFPHNKWNRSYGYGIGDAYKAVKVALEWKPPEIPNTPPILKIGSPKNNTKVSGTITISGTAFDSDGNVTNVEIRFDENDWFNISVTPANSLKWTYMWHTKDVENGMHTISVRCFDGMNYSRVVSVTVNVYNKVFLGGAEEKMSPIYLIASLGVIGAVVVIVVCVLLFRKRKAPSLRFPLTTAVPSLVPSIPSIDAQCPNCKNIIKITSKKRPFKIKCPKCGTRCLLR